MPRKKTCEEVNKIFKNRGLSLVEGQKYINSKTKLNCYDNQNYFYQLTTGDVEDKRTKNFSIVDKSNKYSIENIQQFLINHNSNVKLLSNNYENANSKLNFLCQCGEVYSINWFHLSQNKKFQCNKCGRKNTADSNIKPIEYCINICKENGYELLLDTYVDLKNFSVTDKFGYKYKTTIYNLLNRSNKCSKFNYKNPHTIFNILNYLDINNIQIKLVDESERQIKVRDELLEFYCIECGSIFKTKLYDVIYENKKTLKRYRCPDCCKFQSNLSYYVEEYLKELNILYVKEKRFNNCRNKNPLPFDFYLPDYNTCIEVNGQQHYYENELFDQTLEERQYIDSTKKEYCFKNKIKYLEIPFWKIRNGKKTDIYKKLINDILNQN